MQRWEELVMEREEGREEGREQALVEKTCRKLRKGKVSEVIAEELEEKVEVIQSICRIADSFAPEYDYEKIYKAWKADLTKPVFN